MLREGRYDLTEIVEINHNSWPNDTVQLIGKIYNAGNVPQENIYDRGGAEFGYDNARPATWKNDPQVWIAGCFAHR